MARLQTVEAHWQRDDFYARHRAEDHFRTEPMTSPRVAEHVIRRIERYRTPQQPVEIFDIGAGDGALVQAIATMTDYTVHGIDIRPKPAHLDSRIHWHGAPPEPNRDALPVVVCHEFLDDVPCEVVECTEDGSPFLLHMDDDGTPHRGPALTDPAAGANRAALMTWMQRWWPISRPYSRAEIGLERDRMWRKLTGFAAGGLAFAIDYGHLLPERLVGTWDGGTLLCFRAGRPASVAFTGDRNITAHVAMDAVAHASAPGIKRLARQRTLWPGMGAFGYSTGAPDDYLWLEVDLRGNPRD
jgi:SAM-dependent MidA family methyltransferase